MADHHDAVDGDTGVNEFYKLIEQAEQGEPRATEDLEGLFAELQMALAGPARHDSRTLDRVFRHVREGRARRSAPVQPPRRAVSTRPPG